MNTQVTEQAPTPSVEERAAAALFGNPTEQTKVAEPDTTEPEQTEPDPEVEGEPEARGDEPTAEETFELEAEGERYALPKKLEKQFLNNKDYTQKSQEVANQRRALDVMNEQARVLQMNRAFEASVSQEMQKLQAYDSVLSQPMDPNLSEADLLRSMVQRNQWKEERESLARSVQGKYQQYSQDHEKAVNDLRSKAKDAVTKRIPNWSDDTWKSIREHATSDGYTDSELNSITDPRHQITLWKAQQFDQLKAKATKTVADVKTVKTTPSNPMPQAVKDKLNFRKAIAKTAPGSMEQKKLVEQRVGSLFAKR
jgi:hypothetical protein